MVRRGKARQAWLVLDRCGTSRHGTAGKENKKGIEMIYKWSETARQNVAAQKVGTEIEKIVAKTGDISARDLVQAASKKRSPLHKLFTWDDHVAADLYRRTQARHVLNSLRVVVESNGEEIPVIAYVSVTVNESPSYVTTATAMSEEQYRKEVLNDALRALTGIQKRYNDLIELQPVFKAIEKIRI